MRAGSLSLNGDDVLVLVVFFFTNFTTLGIGLSPVPIFCRCSSCEGAVQPKPVLLPKPVLVPEPVQVPKPVLVPKLVLVPELVPLPELVLVTMAVPKPVLLPKPVPLPKLVLVPGPVLGPKLELAPNTVWLGNACTHAYIAYIQGAILHVEDVPKGDKF